VPFKAGLTIYIQTQTSYLKHNIIFSEIQNKIDKKSKDFTSLNQKIIHAAEEEKSFMDERLRASKTDKRRRRQRGDDTDFSEEEGNILVNLILNFTENDIML
jgi:hypothetical protein